eukprot:TRINITY_DN8122_c0_g1_i2.p1 TRINITY_DN8122_c0_g1~~TRINITY_DN8122_c0_g1_i2.p1  ORF type:complete len:1153 (-),score=236.13 TRINITY_DN8122_c0_g1_i2:781-4239(-)
MLKWAGEVARPAVSKVFGFISSKAVDWYADQVEEIITKHLTEWLEPAGGEKLDLTSDGPITGIYRDLRLTRHATELVRQLTGFEVLLSIRLMKLRIDVEEMYKGDNAWESVGEDQTVVEPEGGSMIWVRVSELMFKAPGIAFQILGLVLQIKPSIPLSTEPEQLDPGPTPSMQHVINQIPAAAAKVLSDWILMGAWMSLRDIRMRVDMEQLPTTLSEHANLSAVLDMQVQQFRIAHDKFHGVNQQLYMRETDKVKALLFHCLNLPLVLHVHTVTISLGTAFTVKIEGPSSRGDQAQDAAIKVAVRHDNWQFYTVTGYLYKYSLSIGSKNHLLVHTETSGKELLSFKFCNQLRNIDGNRKVLRRIYQANVGGVGGEDLEYLRAQHSRDETRLQTLRSEHKRHIKELREHAGNHEEHLGEADRLAEEIAELESLLELSSLKQDRYFEVLYFAHCTVEVGAKTRVDVDAGALTECGCIMMVYVYSWLEKHGDTNEDGNISMDEWKQLIKKQLFSQIPSHEADEISEEQWHDFIGLRGARTASVNEQLAEAMFKLEEAKLTQFGRRLQKLMGTAAPLMTGEATTAQLVSFERLVAKLQSLASEIRDDDGVFQVQTEWQVFCSSRDGKNKSYDPKQRATREEVALLLEKVADGFRTEYCQSLLQNPNEPAPLGIELQARINLPIISYAPNDSEIMLDLGYVEANCTPSEVQTEDGNMLPGDQRSPNTVKITSSGCCLKIHNGHDRNECLSHKIFHVITMPARLLAVVGWKTAPGAVSLQWDTVQEITIDFFAKQSSDVPSSSTEAEMTISIFEPAVLTWYRLMATAVSDARRARKTQEDQSANTFSTKQLQLLSEGLTKQRILLHWLVPHFRDSADLKISARIHFLVQVLFIRCPSDPHRFNQMFPNPETTLLRTSQVQDVIWKPRVAELSTASEKMLHMAVNGFELVLQGRQTFITNREFKLVANLCLVEHFVRTMIAIMTGLKTNPMSLTRESESCGSAGADRMSEIEQQLRDTMQESGMSVVEVRIPSDTETSAGVMEGSTVKLVTKHGFVDGVTLTAPSILVVIGDKNEEARLGQEARLEFQTAQICLDGRVRSWVRVGLDERGWLASGSDTVVGFRTCCLGFRNCGQDCDGTPFRQQHRGHPRLVQAELGNR